VLAREARSLGELDATPLVEARNALESPGVSVVEPALLATSLGASALHDPTEGGLAGGLHEMAAAAGVGIVVDRDAVLWFAPGVAVCEALGADPWSTLASGTLLATFSPAAVEDAVRALNEAGHQAAVIGGAEEGAGVRDSRGNTIRWPERDEVARLLSEPEDGDPQATI
jgi:hydrogenase maturation factor